MERSVDGWRKLMAAIVRKAFADKDRAFFQSAWGETLCEETDIRVLEDFNRRFGSSGDGMDRGQI